MKSMIQCHSPKGHVQPEGVHYASRGMLTGAIHMQPSLWSLTLITMLQNSMKGYGKDFHITLDSILIIKVS